MPLRGVIDGALERGGTLQASGCVILVVDVQRYCTDPERGCHKNQRRSDLPYFFSRLEQSVLPGIAALLATARFSKAEVVYTVIESLTADGRDRGLDYKLSGISVPRGHTDAAVHPAVAPGADEVVLSKTTCSPFASTPLEHLLRALGTTRLVVCGLLTNQCVESAVREAADRGYNVVVVEDCCAARSREEHDGALRNLRGFARIAASKQLVAELKACQASPSLLIGGGVGSSSNGTKKRARAGEVDEFGGMAVATGTGMAFGNMGVPSLLGNGAGPAAGVLAAPPLAERVLRIALLHTEQEGVYGSVVPQMFREMLAAVAAAAQTGPAATVGGGSVIGSAAASPASAAALQGRVAPIHFELSVFDTTQQEYPMDRSQFAGFIVPGSPCSAYDDVEWVQRLAQEIRTLHAERRPLLGVCFGHQIIAQALGGEARKSPNNSKHYARQWFQLLPFDAGGASAQFGWEKAAESAAGAVVADRYNR